MDEALELEDIDAAYCLLFLREVRDAAFTGGRGGACPRCASST